MLSDVNVTERCEHIRAARFGAAGRLKLDRSRKINALTLPMVRALREALDVWRDDSSVRHILIDGTGDRGFCAGGDLRALYDDLQTNGGTGVETFWSEEYRLNATIAHYPKPVVSFMDGIVMGGGIGLGAHASVRVVTDTTQVAMPEVAVGLIPDVGATRLLSRAPGETGTYLALAAARADAADALALGLADVCVPQSALGTLARALCAVEAGTSDALRTAIQRVATPAGESRIMRHRALIDRAFRFDRVLEIVAELEADGSPFAIETARRIAEQSPLSLELTLRALRAARALATLEDCLRLEYRIMVRLLRRPDFPAGVRAAVIDKGRRPAWHPLRLRDIRPSMLDAFFEPLGPQEWTT